eukprot:GHVS01024986.1.p1 GENE.GHVS01024986.1~~GHVS01024986.1.p1  ORF type:complete len:403 (+),score=42.38 GHVS01024986.1:198-1406(+)
MLLSSSLKMRWLTKMLPRVSRADQSTAKPLSPMRDLIETAETIFTGATPTLRQIGMLRRKLIKCSLADLGYTQDSLKSSMLKPHEWHELHLNSLPPHVIPVHSTSRYHVVAFVLPLHSCLELHDHIGMLVLSSLMLGCAHLTAYHLIKPLSQDLTGMDKDNLVKSECPYPIKRNYAVLRESEMVAGDSEMVERCESTEIDHVDLLEGYGKETQYAKCASNLFLCERVFDGPIQHGEDDMTFEHEGLDAHEGADLRETELYAGAGTERAVPSNPPLNNGRNERSRAAMSDGEHHKIRLQTDVDTAAMEETFCYKRIAEEVLYGRRSAIIFPSVCNIHEIRSTDELTVMLDILSPPYGQERECWYFRVKTPESRMADTELRILERCEYGGPDYFHELPFLGQLG